MPPKRPVRRSLPTPRKPRPKSETPSRDGSSSPDPLDIISNKGSPESQRRQSVYISKSKSRASESGSGQSFSSSLQHTPKADDTEDSSSSDSLDSVKDQYRRQRRYSDGPEGESESEDEWSNFLSSSAKKQRRQSTRSSIGSSASSRSSTAETDNTPTPTTSQTEWPLIPVPANRPFQLNPVRSRPTRMVDEHMHEAEVKVENVVQAERNVEVVGMNADVDLVKEPERLLPAVQGSDEGPMKQEHGEDLPSQTHEVDAGTSDSPEEPQAVNSNSVVQDEAEITEIVENDIQAHMIGGPADETKDPPNDNAEKPKEEPSEIHMPSEIDIQPDTSTGMEVETVPEVGKQNDSPQAEPVNHAPPVEDAQTSGEDQQMAENDRTADPKDDIPDPIPAGMSEAGNEEGEEELDEDIAATPEAEAEAEADTANADIEMDGSSAPAESAPVAEVKIRKKPGPKPKPKVAGQKVEAAAKKAVKGTKGKKVDELKSTSKKNARFTPVSFLSLASLDMTADGRNPIMRARYLSHLNRMRIHLIPSAIGHIVFAERRNRRMMTMLPWSDVNRELPRPTSCRNKLSIRCDDWFHASCVGLTEDQVRNMDVYICRSCERST